MAGIPLNSSDLYSSSGSAPVGSRIPIGQAVLKQKQVTTDAVSYPILFDDVSPSSPAGTFSGIGCKTDGSIIITTPSGSFVINGATSGLTFANPFVLTVGSKTYTFDTTGDPKIQSATSLELDAGLRSYKFSNVAERIEMPTSFTLAANTIDYNFSSIVPSISSTLPLSIVPNGIAYTFSNTSAAITFPTSFNLTTGATSFTKHNTSVSLYSQLVKGRGYCFSFFHCRHPNNCPKSCTV